MDYDYVVAPSLVVSVAALAVWFCLRRIRKFKTKAYSRWRIAIEACALSLVAIPLLLLSGSSAFNAAAVLHSQAAIGPPGTVYTVKGHKMHLYCTGAGAPTLVLDAGLGNDSLIWGGIQPILSRTTRVCSYDRAGFGWSDPLPPPRDADHIAGELHELLLKAGIDGPVILMGHSIAGLYIRDYAAHYPQHVAGLIFIDASTPLQDGHTEPSSGLPLPLLLLKSANLLGIPRALGACTQALPGFDSAAGRLLAEDLCHPHISAAYEEARNFVRSSEQAAHSGPFGTLPILIISGDTDKTGTKERMAGTQRSWNEMQEDLKRLSVRSRRIVAQNSSHDVHIDRPDLLIKEIPVFIGQIRGASGPAPMYGRTTID